MRGREPLQRYELTRVRDRISFAYVEKATIARDNNAITIRTEDGVTYVPGASLACLMAGPGTSITHQGMSLLGECGVSLVWVGERGIRYYAHGRSLSSSTRYLVQQAKIVSNNQSRLDVARRMYAMRFPGEDVAGLTMQQLRGREGARVKNVYREQAERTGIDWRRRQFDPQDFDSGDPVNQALSAAHTCLYGLVHAVIVSLGASAGLGFIHHGHERAFVYDIADLYKAQTSIPLAFDVAAEEPVDIGSTTRFRMRDAIAGSHLIDVIVKDVTELFFPPDQVEDAISSLGHESNVVNLWDPKKSLAGGTNYGDF